MNIVCLDLEGVLVPEIWIAFAKETGIEELKRTTRDEPDYDKLMKYRIAILKEHGLGLKKKLGYPTIMCNELVVSETGEITDFKMRCENSKLTTVKALQSIGYDTICAGDSHNDLGMILNSKAGFLFKSTDAIKAEHKELEAFEEYDELLAAIKKAL